MEVDETVREMPSCFSHKIYDHSNPFYSEIFLDSDIDRA
jgi:hypothetical protein